MFAVPKGNVWWAVLSKMLQDAPVVVKGVEIMKAEGSGLSKKQIAVSALLASSGALAELDPEDTKAATAAATAADLIIEAVVQGTNSFRPSPVDGGAAHSTT